MRDVIPALWRWATSRLPICPVHSGAIPAVRVNLVKGAYYCTNAPRVAVLWTQRAKFHVESFAKLQAISSEPPVWASSSTQRLSYARSKIVQAKK